MFNRLLTTSSSPTNAPPQMNRMFEVFISIISPCGCFLLSVGGMRATVPSIIFNNACCTPSPLTSRVIDMFSPLRAILSISSIYIMPRSAFLTSPSAIDSNRLSTLSTSSPTYPASVKLVASQIANGRSKNSAIFLAIIVLPQPVGPRTRTFVFSN